MSSEPIRERRRDAAASPPRLLRADLHVHSYHSGYASHMRFLRARDCYSEPEAVYRVAKARGMDLVTITDHDSIGGCLEFLDRHPEADDFFVSEEIECLVPGLPLKVHIGAYDINEKIHREVQSLRRSVYDTVEYLRGAGVFFTLNHLFFFLRQQMPCASYLAALLPLFSAFEVRNGTMIEAHNTLIETILADRRRAGWPAVAVGGSDAHTLAAIATTYTEAPGRNRAEFLSNLRAGHTQVAGQHGGSGRVMREIYGVVGRYWASLVGIGRQELSWRRRAVGLGFSAVSMPAEFIPALIALVDKRGERRRIAAYRHEWEAMGAMRDGLKAVPYPMELQRAGGVELAPAGVDRSLDGADRQRFAADRVELAPADVDHHLGGGDRLRAAVDDVGLAPTGVEHSLDVGDGLQAVPSGRARESAAS
jgi:predicted metal-dependent phosphoesterase TrpH